MKTSLRKIILTMIITLLWFVPLFYSLHRLHEDFVLEKHSCVPEMKTLKTHIDNIETILEE